MLISFFVCIYYILQRPLHQAEESQYIVQIRHNKQQQEDCESHVLCTLHELIARLTTCNYLVEEEEYMTAIQCRNRQDIHECQDNAQECCHHPEGVPIPHRREETAQGSETAQTLGTLLGEYIFHIAYIARKHIPAILHTSRETLEEAITDMGYLVIEHHRMIVEAELHTLIA